MEHWLFSALLRSPPNAHFFAYVMGNDQKAVEVGCGRMTAVCAESGFEIMSADNVLVSMLDADGVKLVREVVSTSRHGREGLAAATDAYAAGWVMGDEDPRAGRLLALHCEGVER
jgi:hypothetical protein